ncbi:MAG: sigma-70 family RNA polymerase sigma factor [Planctomycetes bacterium]|nr:sigma-70 family RNA polymerase sigma factor [Planctomycetota bacterium]
MTDATHGAATDADSGISLDPEELVRRYQRRVYAVIYRLVGTHAETDDLSQEAFLQIFRSLPRFRAGTDLDAWVYRIASNVAVDFLRRRAKDTRLLTRLRAAPPPEEVGPAAAPDAEVARAVRTAVDELPPDQKSAIVLRIFEGRSHEEIARIQAIPLATVRWRLFTARRKLEGSLGSLLEE